MTAAAMLHCASMGSDRSIPFASGGRKHCSLGKAMRINHISEEYLGLGQNLLGSKPESEQILPEHGSSRPQKSGCRMQKALHSEAASHT